LQVVYILKIISLPYSSVIIFNKKYSLVKIQI